MEMSRSQLKFSFYGGEGGGDWNSAKCRSVGFIPFSTCLSLVGVSLSPAQMPLGSERLIQQGSD